MKVKGYTYSNIPHNLPEHVAIIMDGNGRWAKKRLLPRSAGHRAGVEALRNIIRMSSHIGIKYLTLYAFSTENWKRPKDEVNVLMKLLVEFLYNEIDELDAENVCITFMGDIEKFPKDPFKAIKYALERTKDNTGLTVCIALNYGSRLEIRQAVKKIAELYKAGNILLDDITDELISSHLDTSHMPDPDLIIRTSGEQRLSNFMLYQASYSEFYFTQAHWPDFGNEEYTEALNEYAKRKRRFGDVK
ncbi:MAG: isoprenyl transferase [Eubacteriales bacterium]